MSGRTPALAGRKAVSGHVITIVITLAVAIAALALLLAFTKAVMPEVGRMMEGVIAGIKEKVCHELTQGILC